jgi:hypothetical protein
MGIRDTDKNIPDPDPRGKKAPDPDPQLISRYVEKCSLLRAVETKTEDSCQEKRSFKIRIWLFMCVS